MKYPFGTYDIHIECYVKSNDDKTSKTGKLVQINDVGIPSNLGYSQTDWEALTEDERHNEVYRYLTSVFFLT